MSSIYKAVHHREAGFVKPMECLAVTKVPEGPGWSFEVKLDGYRMEVVRTAAGPDLYSRNRTLWTATYRTIAKAAQDIPAGTVLDGELVALNSQGHPDFHLLQTAATAKPNLAFIAFDILILRDQDLMRLPLTKRREILQSVVQPNDHLNVSVVSKSAPELLALVRAGYNGMPPLTTTLCRHPTYSQVPYLSRHRYTLGPPLLTRLPARPAKAATSGLTWRHGGAKTGPTVSASTWQRHEEASVSVHPLIP